MSWTTEDPRRLSSVGCFDSAAVTSDPRPTFGTPYRELVARGFNPTEAGNLTAYLNGMTIGRRPWALTELNNVLFLKYLYRSGQLGR
jgi:hypothetical protein